MNEDLVKRHKRWTYAELAEDPDMMRYIEQCWRNGQHALVLGEDPVGAVLATKDGDGITFHYYVRP